MTLPDPDAFGQPRVAWQALGAITGIVQLADILTDSPSRWGAANCYHWVLEFPAAVNPVLPCPGRPGLWDPPATVLRRLAGVIEL